MIIWTSDCTCGDCETAIKTLRENIYTKTYSDEEFSKLLKDNQLTKLLDLTTIEKEGSLKS